MKQAFYKISSILMAIVVLLSTMSFTIDSHYCGDNLVNTAIFYKVESCGMEMQNPSTEDCSITKKDCCHDEQISIEGQHDLRIFFNTLTFNQHLTVVLFAYLYFNLFEGLEKNVTSYRDYVPILVKRQIYKLDETYII